MQAWDTVNDLGLDSEPQYKSQYQDMDKVEGTVRNIYSRNEKQEDRKVVQIATDNFPIFSLDQYPSEKAILRDYMMPITEAPSQYHLLAGLMMVSTVIESKDECSDSLSRL